MAATDTKSPAERRKAALAANAEIRARLKGTASADWPLADIEAMEKNTATAEAAAREQGEDADRASRAAAAALAAEEQETAARRSTGRTVPAGASTTVEPMVAKEAFLKDSMRGFRSHRDFFEAVRRVGQRGECPDNLKSLSAKFGRQADGSPVQTLATAGSDEQSTFSDSYGGFLVPKVTAPGVLAMETEGDFLASLTRKVPMAAPEVNFNARVDKNHSTSVSGGLVVYRRAEASAVTATRQQYEQVSLKADSLMGLSYATEEVLRDSPVSIAGLLADGYRDEFGARKVIERLGGTGAGEFYGVNTSGALIEVSKETGQPADTIVTKNILKMRARCWGYGNAVWLANQDTFVQIAQLVFEVGTGGVPLMMSNASGPVAQTLLGRPIIFTEFCEPVGDAGDILLVNFREYLEGEYEPIQGASSEHVRFVEHEQAFKFWTRCAGAPWWRSAFQPKKSGSPTLSPFVRLAARA